MEELDIQTLYTLQKECSDRIKAAQREIEQCSILLKSFNKEIQARRSFKETSRTKSEE